MEELKQEEPLIEIYKPIKIKIGLNGYTKTQDNKYIIRWFDNTEKIVEFKDIEYMEYDFLQALYNVTTLQQLNPSKILTIKLSTI